MSRKHSSLALWAMIALAGVLGGRTLGGCLERRSDELPTRGRCTACHGSQSRAGTDFEKAAPPVDLSGGTATSRRGVGAHQIHLNAGDTHGKVSCDQCHVVPDSVESPGHTDSKLPAEITFGELAKSKGHEAAEWDPENTTCNNTYCHRSAKPNWTSARPSDEACGTCHGLPPPPPHIKRDDCFNCHTAVIDKDRHFIAPELHVNGTVDLKGIKCNGCHGTDPNAPAPPPDVEGNTDRSAIGVGAHQVHLAGGQHSRPLACGECHNVPTSIDAPGHIDDTPNAEVVLTGIANSKNTSPAWVHETKTCGKTWCHGPEDPAGSASPLWNQTSGPIACNQCHGTPPKPPHPQLTNCSLCHTDVINPDNTTFKNRDLHVNGTIDVKVPSDCNTCHGDATADPTLQSSWAPPKDLSGNTDTKKPGVGAHQTHLSTSSYFRTVQCNECHVVPQTPLDKGHFDTPLPAELTFSGVAITNGATPSFDAATLTCKNVYCHGNNLIDGLASGGAITEPVWTGTGQVYCGSCHSLPPPAPKHPIVGPTECSNCHSDLQPGTLIFSDPSKHVNGQLD